MVSGIAFKLLEEIIGHKLFDIDLGNDFLDLTSKAEKKRQPTEWRKYLQLIYLKNINPLSDKKLSQLK